MRHCILYRQVTNKNGCGGLSCQLSQLKFAAGTYRPDSQTSPDQLYVCAVVRVNGHGIKPPLHTICDKQGGVRLPAGACACWAGRGNCTGAGAGLPTLLLKASMHCCCSDLFMACNSPDIVSRVLNNQIPTGPRKAVPLSPEA